MTQLYANVGDGISASEASDEMISTLKGFQMQADEAQKIVDSFNEVGNNFAISSAGIGAALQRSAAAFNAANTDLNQAIALTVAANDAVQDPDSVGTMWATVAARIRGAKTELEDLGEDTEDVLSTSKLRELVKGISGVDIMKDESTFKDIYTIIDEIGQKWDSISDINQASLLEALAGKKQSNRLASALNNIEDLEAAYQTAENSAGSAEREQEEYSKSISYHMKSAQASIQEFVTTLASSGQINAIIDVFSGLVDGATKLSDTLGGIPSIVSAIVGAIAGAKGDWLSIVGTNKNDALWSINDAQQWNERTNLWENTGGIEVGGLIGGKKARNQQLQNIVQEFNDLDITAGDWEDRVAKLTVKYGDYGNAIKGFAENNKGAKITIEDLAGSTQAFSIGAKVASFGVKALGVALNMVATTLIVAGIQALVTWIYKLANAAKDAKAAAENVMSTIDANNRKMEDNVRLVKESGEQYLELAKGVDKFGHNISLSEEDYDTYVNLTKELAEAFPELVQGYNDLNNPVLQHIDNIQQLNDVLKENQQLQAHKNVYGKEDDAKYNNIQTELDSYQKNRKTYAYTNDTLSDYKEASSQEYEDALKEYLTNPYKTAREDTKNASLIYRTHINDFNDLKEGKKTLDDFGRSVRNEYIELHASNQAVLKNMNSMATDMVDALNFDDALGLSDEQLSQVKSIASNLGLDFYDGLTGSLEEQQGQMESMIMSIVDNAVNSSDDKVKDAVSKIFSLEDLKDQVSYEEYQQIVDGIIKVIAEKFRESSPEIYNALMDMINASVPDVAHYSEAIGNGLKNAYDTVEGTSKTTYSANGTPVESLQTRKDIFESAVSAKDSEIDEATREAMVSSQDFWDEFNAEESKTDAIVRNDVKEIAELAKKSWEKVGEEIREQTKVSGSQALKTLQSQLAPAMDSLSAAYQSIFNGGDDGKTFNMAAVTAEQIESIVGQLEDFNANENIVGEIDTKSIDKFVDILGDVNTKAPQAQQAFDDLATELVNAVIPNIDKLTASSYAMAEQALQEMGVANAEEVLVSRLGMSFDEYAKAKEEASSVGLNTDGDIQNLSSLNTSVIGSRTELIKLIEQKIRTNQIAISTSGDIGNLIQLGEAADWAGAKLDKLAQIKVTMANLETTLKNIGNASVNSGEQALNEKRKGIESTLRKLSTQAKMLAESEFEPVSVSFDGGNAANTAGGKGKSGSGSGSKDADKTKEQFEEDIDWIERASKKLTDNLHDIQGVVDDTFTNWDGRLQHVAKEYENLTAQMDLAQKAREYYLKKANAVALPAEYKKKVLNGEINVETIRDENLKKLIEDYQSFWDKYVQYEQQFYDLSRERMAMLSKEIDMISQRWDDKISDVEHSSAMADLDVNTGDITGQLPALNKQRANAIREISLVEQERAAIAKKMAEANVNHDSEEYQKWKKQLQELDEKVVSLKENLQDIAKQKFDAINNQFEFLANQIDHANNRMQSLSDIATAMGYYASNEFIKTEKKVAEVNYANASARRDELQRSLNEAVANGAVKEGSDAWIEMKNAIEDATDSVFQYTAAIEQAKQKLRQWDWDAQDYINERTQRIFDTNQFFIDQLEQSKMFADNGGFIDRSNAQQGLHVSQYSIYLAEAKKYAEAIQDINDQLASDPYDIELIARRETLIDQQREMIKGAKSEKEAIRDLVKNSYDTFLNYLQMLIDKRKEALEAEQDLFEYEKNIREQTKQIASYQKQLSSIKADNSEENRLRIQQLTNSLTDAQEQLQETEHDRWRTDQEALMDQMYNSFEELINTRLDDIDGVLHEAIQRTTENTANIVATIQAEANRIGVDVSSSLNVLYTLDNTLNTQFGTLADDIANHTSTLVDNLDSQGQAIVDAGNRAAMTVTGDGHTTLADINNMLNNILAAIGRLQSNINNYGYGSGGSSGGSRPSSSSSSSSSTVKGYRLYNPNGGGGQHLFTTSAAERDRLIKAGWREEAGSGFSTSGTAIQRYYNPNNGDHMYTINPTEQNTLKNAGWKYEGVAGYASGSGKTTYRLLNPNTGTHMFTSNPAEVAKLVAAGWKKEGTAWKDAAFAQGGTIGKAIKRTGEDGIILARTGEEVLSLDKIEGMKQVLAMFEPLAKMQQSAPNVKSTIGGSNVTVGDITTTLSLPNVENYEQFVEKAKADPRFEKLVQQMTLGNALGQSSLKKFNL